MNSNPTPAIDRIPLAHSVRYVVRGLPELPYQHGRGTLVPSEITLTYRAAPDSQLGRVHAFVAGRIHVDGQEIPHAPYGQHYDEGLSNWPAWLAEEARLHDPAATPSVSAVAQTTRDRIAEALHHHLARTADIRPSRGGDLAFMPEVTDEERMRITDAVLAVLPPPADPAEAPLSPYYSHEACGFHWHGRDGMDIPMRDGQPVCPRCELVRAEAEAHQYRTALQGAARRDAVVSPPPATNQATLLRAADTVEAMNEGCGQAKPCASCDAREDAAGELRRMAAEATVVPPPVLTEEGRLRARVEVLQQDSERDRGLAKVGARCMREGHQGLIESGRAVIEGWRFALSTALGLGTGAPWEAIHERVKELAEEPAVEAQQQPEGAAPGEAFDLADGPVRCPLCPNTVTLHTPNGARTHFTTVHPEQRVTGRGPGPWPLLVTDGAEAQQQTDTEMLPMLFWDETARAVHHDGRITVLVNKAANLVQFAPAGQLILQVPEAARLRAELTTALNDAAEETVSGPGGVADEEQPTEVVHACPPDGSGLTPCCGRTPFELPLGDRISSEAPVTCPGAVVSQPGKEEA